MSFTVALGLGCGGVSKPVLEEAFPRPTRRGRATPAEEMRDILESLLFLCPTTAFLACLLFSGGGG